MHIYEHVKGLRNGVPGKILVFLISDVSLGALLKVGLCLTGEKDSMIFDCTERYDPVTKQWAAVASLNFPRCGVGVCPCHGALYALGSFFCRHN